MPNSTTASPALECRKVLKLLGDKTVLASLDVTVHRGEVVSLVGASGSGKTTLLRSIAGLIAPDDGEIELMGDLVWSKRRKVPAEDRHIGMVFQDYALWPHMTIVQNLRFGLEAQHMKADEINRRVDHALEVTRLGPMKDRRPSQLSGGQQQRVAIARCLAARPRLLLLDEPLSNLDAALRDDLRAEMVRLIRAEGITAIYVTHDQAEAMAVSDRLAVMDRGTIAQFASPQEIYEAPANAFVAKFLGGFSLLSGRAEGDGFVTGGGAMRLRYGSHRISGDAVLVVRPEDGRPGDSHPENRLRGEVIDSAYQGRCWRLMLKVASDVVRLDWPTHVNPGSAIEFSLPPDRCTVLQAGA
ncbi:MAG: transporter ATP-binding protein [Hyphomicrobiales bacterium]|nr:transporter ATP-binding protein [Hyphomicrobiales bacterium]